jgi:hypothetical protein
MYRDFDEGKELMQFEDENLEESVGAATIKNYPPLIEKIAAITDEIKREHLIKKLAARLDISVATIKKGVKGARVEEIQTEDNVIIAHPAYDTNSDFISLGFKETIVKNDRPVDQNIYIVVHDNNYSVTSSSTLNINERKIIFNDTNRLLIELNDKWNKNSLQQFLRGPRSPEDLYHEIKDKLKEFIEFQKEPTYGLIASWIIATYFHRYFFAFPFLFIYGKKQTGKSRLLDFLERLAFNAIKIKGVSVASLADSIDGVRGTFLNDQAENLSDPRNAELLGILSDSYTPGGGKRRIVDMSNNKRRVLEFETYGPKAFASIKEIDPDLKDRCIHIPMIRATQDFPYPEPYLRVWGELRDKLYRFLLTRYSEIKEIYERTGEGVSQRVRELWRPLETALRLENVPEDEMGGIRSFFLESMLETQSELTDHEEELFQVLFALLEGGEKKVLSIQEIADCFKNEDGVSKRSLTTWTGKTLRQFSLYHRQAGRKDRKRAYLFSLDHVKDIYLRYQNIGGFSGNVVKSLEYQTDISDHIQKTGGSGTTECGTDIDTDIPLPLIGTTSKNEVAHDNSLDNKDKYHLTEKTTEKLPLIKIKRVIPQ